jgi:hypothetical protein
MASECGADHSVVVVSQLRPPPWTDARLVLGRGHDVGEEDGHGPNVALRPAARTGQEFLDLVGQGVDVAGDEQVVVAGQDDQTGIGDVFGQVLTRAQSYEGSFPRCKISVGHEIEGKSRRKSASKLARTISAIDWGCRRSDRRGRTTL